MRPTRTAAALTALVAATAALSVTATPAQAAEVSVSGVQFRWGFNHESNNRGAAPGTFNLFSAGKLGNPGSSQLLSNANEGTTWAGGQAAGWKPRLGNVHIEKLRADGGYAPATWAGTKTDKDGVSLAPYSSSTKFSEHQVVIDNGTGTLDAEADSADISWDGDFTVVYYSGYTFFYVSDPTLTVEDGVGTVTATLGGYGTDMDDMSQWVQLPDTQVTLATLSGVDVTAEGLVATPAYREVMYDAPAQGVQQVRTGDWWGSFPTSFANFQQLTGQGAYWYSSGGSVDKNKLALPLTVDTTPAPHEEAPRAASTLGVSASATAYGRASRVTVAVTPATATGTVALTGLGGALTAPVAGGRATFALPATLRPGRYALTASYAGDDRLLAASSAGALSVAKAGVAKPRLKVTTKPTRRKRGQVLVTVASATPAAASGRVTLKLVSGKARKTVRATLARGRATVRLPKLAKGKWKVAVTYAGSATHASAAKGYTVRVR